jgi:hypothetical protein
MSPGSSWTVIFILAAAVIGSADAVSAPDTIGQESTIKAKGTRSDSLPYYFYQAYDFGTQSKYNPGDFFFNGGFGVWQFAGTQKLLDFPYEESFKGTGNSLLHPIKAIQEFGVEEWFFSEICPRSLEMKHGQFVPNYFLHTLGAGMQSRKMEEWYRYHNVPCPRLWSITTMLVEHYFEEMIENGGSQALNKDPVSDYYLFNPAGILLFLNEGVCRFFSKKLILNEWSLQPSINFRTGKLENGGQFYVAKLPLGRTSDWGLVSYFGMQEMFGITRTFSNNRSFSIMGGPIVNNLLDASVSETQKAFTASFRWSAGAFYDIKNSALVSLCVSGADHNKLRLNVYPGLLRIGKFSPGFFIQNTGEWVTGISVRYCPLGASVGSAGN